MLKEKLKVQMSEGEPGVTLMMEPAKVAAMAWAHLGGEVYYAESVDVLVFARNVRYSTRWMM